MTRPVKPLANSDFRQAGLWAADNGVLGVISQAEPAAEKGCGGRSLRARGYHEKHRHPDSSPVSLPPAYLATESS